MPLRSPTTTLIETERLKIRTIARDDADELYEVYSYPPAMRWVDDGTPIAYEDCLRWVEVTTNNYRTRGYGLSAITLKETNEIIGFCGLVHPRGQLEPEIKYALKAKHWGKGYATECVAAMLRYGYRQHGLDTIIATVASENKASQKVLEKSGLRFREALEPASASPTFLYAWTASERAAS